MTVKIETPTMGESISEATVASWTKQEGDMVTEDEMIAELETDKVNLEVTAPATGKLVKIVAPSGSSVKVGQLMGEIEEGATGASPAPTQSAAAATPAVETVSEPAPVEEVATPVEMPIEETKQTMEIPADIPLSPAVRKLVEENNVDPSKISGTGKSGRITKGDVLEYMAKVTVMGAGKEVSVSEPATTSESPSTATSTERETITSLPNIRKVIAKRLKTSQNEAALLTTYNEVDLSNVMDLRKLHQEKFVEEHGVKLGFMSFFTKAVIEALKAWPALNAEIREDNYVQKNFYDIGIAVSTEKGLMVPVLRDADKMSFAEIELAIKDMAERARTGKISIDEMQGGSFTITNGGVFGSMMSMPIINYPQSGILGMHAIKERPVVVDGEIVIRPMMYVAMTYDHRIVDGRESVSFLVKVKECLEDPAKMLLGV
jgi:2-oxoglutarate dehydrogenase E2 component (dihydrolipoamide succinyltransferase)